jgi:hypothetical protein
MVLTQKHVDVWRSLHIFRAFSARLPWGMYLQNNGYAAKPLTARWPEDGRLLKMGYPKSSKSFGWWFQTFFIFHNIWDSPSHWRNFSKGLKPPTSHWLEHSKYWDLWKVLGMECPSVWYKAIVTKMCAPLGRQTNLPGSSRFSRLPKQHS